MSLTLSQVGQVIVKGNQLEVKDRLYSATGSFPVTINGAALNASAIGVVSNLKLTAGSGSHQGTIDMENSTAPASHITLNYNGTGTMTGSTVASTGAFKTTTTTGTFAGLVADGIYGLTIVESGQIQGSSATVTISTRSGGAPLPPPPASNWTATGSMNVSRIRHTATLLSSNMVLVTGGLAPSNQPIPAPQLIAVSSADLFDPTAGVWTLTGSMGTPRVGHATALLPGGQVLVAGGRDAQDNPLATTETFNPATGAWTPTGSMSQPRAYFTATTLNDGRVLVVGNTVDGADKNRVELFDPATGTWSITGSLNRIPPNLLASPRPDGAATRLVDGRVLFVSFARFAEVFDPATGTWTPTGDVVEIVARPAATLLNDGRVLVAGGLNCPAGAPCFVTSSAELYNPATNTWTVTGSLTRTRDQHTATLLPSGRVLVAGGDQGNTATSEVIDPATGSWSSAGPMVTVDFRFAHTATRLNDGRVLVAGGQGSPSPGGGAVASAELFHEPTISPPALSQVTLSPASVVGGTASTVTVSLTAAVTVPTAVSLSSSNPAIAAVPASVTVPAGSSSATATVQTQSVTASTAVAISATFGGVTKTVSLGVTAAAPPTPPPGGTVTVKLAQYDAAKRILQVEVTDSRGLAQTITILVASTSQTIGTLTSAGGGTFKGQFTLAVNPQNITIVSSLGWSMTASVTAK